jgi:hypothetical protein
MKVVAKMSSYTIPLKDIVALYSMDESMAIKDQIETARPKLFDFDYPIFDENYRNVFETHFIRNFFMREIGFESEGLFKFNLETWLNIHMPYFNKIFESELIDYDPLTNTKMDESSNRKGSSNQTSTSSSDSTSATNSTNNANGTLTDNQFNRELESNNPDTRLQLTANNGSGVIEYASNIKENSDTGTKTSNNTSTGSANDTSSATSTSNGSLNNTEDYLSHKFGKIGSQTFSAMINEYRGSLQRVEKMIFKEMQELFMLVY